MIVVVERSFASPGELAMVRAREHRGAWCLGAHGVRFLMTFASNDGRRVLCLYDAPDAESVRLAQTRAGLPFEAAWPARRIAHGPRLPLAGERPVIVERLLPRTLDEEEVRGTARAKAWCLALHRCRIVESFLSTDGRRMVCRFEAPDAESVRQAQRTAGLPVRDVWPATVREAPA